MTDISIIREALEEAATYFDNRADAEYFTDSPRPVGNEEMSLLTLCDNALRVLEKLENPGVYPKAIAERRLAMHRTTRPPRRGS